MEEEALLENFSENRVERSRRRRGRPSLLSHRTSRNEQDAYYRSRARDILSTARYSAVFEWIYESKTLLTEIGRIKNPDDIIRVAERISNERRHLPNGTYWPTAQALRTLVHRWRISKEAAGSSEQMREEIGSLIEEYRARHPKLKKADVTRALNYLLFIYKGTPWGNNRPDEIVHRGKWMEVKSHWPSDRDLDKEHNARRRAERLTTPKYLRDSR